MKQAPYLLFLALASCSALPTTPMSSQPSLADGRHAGEREPVLYVGGMMLSEYRLGGLQPVHSVELSAGVDSMALDPRGNLYVAQGGIDYGGVFIYNARTLTKLAEIDAENSQSLAFDRNGYLYDANCSVVSIYPPHGHKTIETLRRNVACVLLSSSSGTLFVGSNGSIDV
ncbi:MAG TPA: hypothetical protein VHS56_09450, partial [Candidatus Cybelea sp.]|nr:hypothetical protein [Candidatus Cybelea sp.]